MAAPFGVQETPVSCFATEFCSDEELFCLTRAKRAKIKRVEFDLYEIWTLLPTIRNHTI